MVNLRPPGLRRPPASRDIIDVEQVTSSSRNEETTSHRSITAKKGTSKPRSTASKPKSKPVTSRTKKGKGKFAFCTLILEGSRQDPVTVDVDTTIGAVDEAPNFDDEDEEEYLRPLPSSIVLNISVKVDGKLRKARGESAQAPWTLVARLTK
jgi:hypothetical protein